MDLSRLSAKQKRIQDWMILLGWEYVDPALRDIFKSTLERYRQLLYSIWESNQISASVEEELANFERKLDQLGEEVRLRALRAN